RAGRLNYVYEPKRLCTGLYNAAIDKTTCKRLTNLHNHWLSSPIGDGDKIGPQFINKLASQKNMQLIKNRP
ncbi:MAG TPA: hypothetical protein VM888_03100, partial [Chitinophagaceae bacterium]|nr:hypothetical protein [Chitinophagaceae bacterium]